MDGMADLIVVTGPPGAGKSTVAQVLSKLFEPGALVVGDELFRLHRPGLHHTMDHGG